MNSVLMSLSTDSPHEVLLPTLIPHHLTPYHTVHKSLTHTSNIPHHTTPPSYYTNTSHHITSLLYNSIPHHITLSPHHFTSPQHRTTSPLHNTTPHHHRLPHAAPPKQLLQFHQCIFQSTFL